MNSNTPFKHKDFAPNLNDLEILLLLIERDTAQFKKERIDELLNTVGQAKGYQDAEKKTCAESSKGTAVTEVTFNILKFEAQEGAKLGNYEMAAKTSNLEEKWTHAYNILRNSNATISARYFGKGYIFSYWIYGEDKIYRQKLKGAAGQ
jgi:hypothetical protein